MAFVGCRSRRRRLSLTGLALCCAVSLAGCAGRITQGETVGIRWRVDELRKTESYRDLALRRLLPEAARARVERGLLRLLGKKGR